MITGEKKKCEEGTWIFLVAKLSISQNKFPEKKF